MPPSAPSLPLAMNSWEVNAFKHTYADAGLSQPSDKPAQQVHDPLIYPGLYSGSGFDLMSVLLQVMSRPSPVIELGPIDCSVALVVCDLQRPHQPIIYCTDTFCNMTGYTRSEVLGNDCLFLQTHQNASRRSKTSPVPDKAVVQRLGQAICDQKEIQARILNFKKDGTPFTNVVSIVPVDLSPAGYRYAVGFQVEAD
ncbi:hypothetical protein N3K66_004841 [Trichothecium roseum]|uniref:Uncharacterized protein n=1 Tax=Trichothecium roseum TaxID=47278 RepID=A0ACC0V2B2_9HYPO|nr:hypothetical protein N3K66_004841 [Trichothecium roseum]